MLIGSMSLKRFLFKLTFIIFNLTSNINAINDIKNLKANVWIGLEIPIVNLLNIKENPIIVDWSITAIYAFVLLVIFISIPF